MKTRSIILTLTSLFIFSFGMAQENFHCPWDSCGFKPGDKVYLFGNDVKLRTAPDTKSKVLELLKIGEWVEIIEKTSSSWPYKGFDSPFYKVKYDDMTGYIIGGLLSLEKKTMNNTNYFFAYSREDDILFLNIRNIKDGDYVENKVQLANPNIMVKAIGNQGLENLNDILYIDYISEACGMEGGSVYFFAHDKGLSKVAELSAISEAGQFSYSETFVFPYDEGGVPGKIVYRNESHVIYEEDSNWSKSSSEIRELSWTDGKLVPDFREKISN
ncbi:SH3 domain-containing protein [Flagellimonas sp. 389]|uniref:SH3 domain-containing protein n=1 Tax=Flagellimonas sp. 389 TaxID=2835862 RepID=UPI001BD34451|nr:SH3 domain-containing protein [Flagellimonas sp. 389]MBS9461891.1 SH3 domain-containing protein [Flagellimonas sp. 389]